MLFKSMLTLKVMVMVMEECLPCLFMTLCSYVFHVFSLFLWFMKCWYNVIFFVRNIRNVWYEKGRCLCVMIHAIYLLSNVMSSKWKNKWRLCVWVLLGKGKGRGPWGLIGGKHGVHRTFILDSQPLVYFFYCFWSMRLSNPLYMSC